MSNNPGWRVLHLNGKLAGNACAFGLLLIYLFSLSTPAAASDKSNASSWIKRCGGESPADMRTRRVQGIFNRVKSASDARGKQSRLYILKCDGWPWAATLQDKNIILTRGAIEAIYGSNDPIKSKDARLAFVLGHELKHVLEDDFWHEQIRKQQFMESNSSLNYGDSARERRRHDERRADEDGFIYASLAGFETADIFNQVRGEDSFLADWATQTSTFVGDIHYSPEQRTDHLKRKFQSLLNAVELFKFGVRLAHFGRYREARILLEDFQNIFPSTQVLNNLGYVYLQMARQEMPPELAYRYWYPALVNFDSGIPPSASRNTGKLKLPKKARDLLISAVKLLEVGFDKDQNQTPAINLVTAFMYLGEFSAARATIERFDNWYNNPQLIGLDALATMEDRRLKNPWDTYSRENFERLASMDNAQDNLIYNYARLLTDTGRKAQAATYLSRLLQRLHRLPKDYQIMVCRELKSKICSNPEDQMKSSALWTMKIRPDDDIDSADTREELKNWGPPIKDKLDNIDATIYRHDNGNSLLALDGIIEIISFRQHRYDFRDQLLAENGTPLHEVNTLGRDKILSYGAHWAALARDDEIREVWVAR